MKTAIVTGGRRGIGLGIAKELVKADFRVVITGVSPSAEDALAELGENALYFKCNSAVDADRKALMEYVDREFGRLDVLVNNAGVAPKIRADILETTEESFDYVVDTNTKGTFFMTQLVANYMIAHLDPENLPMIINISSMSAYTSSVNRGEYCISKAGISMVTALFADRLSEYGINVYEVRPGIIKTDMTSKVTGKYDALIEDGITPIKRWGYPEDIGKAVAAIAGGAFPFSTGEVFNVDGGFHLRRL